MQIILLERVEKLGQMGEVVRVKDGYARNYLLPQKKALRATEDNIASFAKQKTQLEAINLDQRKEAESVAEKLDGLKCVVLRQASEGGQLFGSVNSRDIADAVTEAGFTVDRKQVLLVATIKNVGIHEVRISLHPEVAVLISVNVARSEAEALSQERGIEPGTEADEEETGDAVDVFENPEDAATAEADSEADGGASNTGVEPGNDGESADQDSRAE